MLRYLSPTLFFAAAVFVYWHNHNDGTSVWVLPMMEVIWPETANNLAARGDKTVIVLCVLGGALMVLQAIKDRQHRGKLRDHFQEPRA
jgi:hypothetical protein